MERALSFECHGDSLPAILHTVPSDAALAVVFVVGGPQYRVGSHRQFVLMARAIADGGIPVLRFDYRGMGDADGESRPFFDTQHDIRAAIDCVFREVPGVRRVALLGLCDGASACMIYSASDPRVSKLVLLNPWARTALRPNGAVRRKLRHYYLPRLLTPKLWSRLLSRKVSVRAALGDLFGLLNQTTESRNAGGGESDNDFVEGMLVSLQNYTGDSLLAISEGDLTAQEFIDLTDEDRAWAAVLRKRSWSTIRIADTDHTFSQRDRLEFACEQILDWLRPL
ncbi:MAG: hydrolase 1, exosortase A system-associated [Pseudomonadota bacterium]